MTVTLLDTETGKKAKVSGFDSYFWEEGNGSCDCNRRTHFNIGILEDHKHCLGSKRFIIVAAVVEIGSLKELNQSYPPELLAKHGIS